MTDKRPEVQKVPLHLPPLEEVARVLQKGMSKNFADVEVNVVECPDLTQKPFMLADKGLCGKVRITDIGGVPYLHPKIFRDKIYDFGKVAKQCELPGAFIIGAGAGPAHHVGVNSEMIPNLKLGKGGENNSHICKINTETDNFQLEKMDFPQCCLLMNLMLSEGKPGKVLEVKAKRRTGKDSIYTNMRHVLKKQYGEKPVGVGGVYLLQKGKAKIHVMPDFSKTPLTSEEKVNGWLRFFEMSAELVSVGCLMSHDPDLDLRIEHFHCFSAHGEGGHYHYDTTPNEAEYLGYFNLAEYMYRIDQPEITHDFGRD